VNYARVLKLLALTALSVWALAGVACGGGERSSGSQRDLDGYVRTLCQAQNTFNADLGAALFGRDSQLSEEEALEVLAPPLRKYRDTLQSADVPGDVRDYHDAFVAAISRSLEAVESGDVTVFGDGGGVGDLPTPSVELRERINESAARVDACEGVSLFSAA
jgi:hypothetical protein